MMWLYVDVDYGECGGVWAHGGLDVASFNTKSARLVPSASTASKSLLMNRQRQRLIYQTALTVTSLY